MTLYTSGYSQKTKTYYYNTYDSPAIIATKLSDFDLDQTTLILA
ncbi:linear amide C-N hydrolase [Candidatus Saccharibacteria bacterium]|nr:linear amide C-N hydrolase [Candidatus Saccharibacteria bacterium]